MPRRSISVSWASVSASWRSPHGLSSGNPSACESRCLIVTRGESLVGYARCVSSGTYRSAGSSSESFPSSRSLRIATAVKLFVIEAIRNTVSRSTGALAATSRRPATPACASSPSTTMPQLAPGTCACSVNCWKIRSISGNAASSFARRCESVNCAGGALTLASCVWPLTIAVKSAVTKAVQVRIMCLLGVYGARWKDGRLSELPNRRHLLHTDTPGHDIGREVVLAAHRNAGKAAHDGKLPDVRQRIGHGSLKEAFRFGTERRVPGEKSVEPRERVEESCDICGPRLRSRFAPGVLAARERDRPVEQIADVRENLAGAAAALRILPAVARAERRELRRNVAEDLTGPIRQRCDGVPQKPASVGPSGGVAHRRIASSARTPLTDPGVEDGWSSAPRVVKHTATSGDLWWARSSFASDRRVDRSDRYIQLQGGSVARRRAAAHRGHFVGRPVSEDAVRARPRGIVAARRVDARRRHRRVDLVGEGHLRRLDTDAVHEHFQVDVRGAPLVPTRVDRVECHLPVSIRTLQAA